MKGKSILKLVGMLLIIGVMIFVAAFGVTVGSWRISPAMEGIKKGLDIAGGSSIQYDADAETVTDEQRETVVSILRTRLTEQGYTEANVQSQGEKRFYVEIPSVSDPTEAVQLLGQTAQLSFVDPDGNVIMTGDDVETASAKYEQLQQNAAAESYVELKLKDSGVQKFSEATGRLAGQPEGSNYISIMLDDQVISSPRVQTQITESTCIISGNFTVDSAKELAGLIRAGQLPFKLVEVGVSSVGATLGEAAFQNSIWAALISLILIAVYMIIFYRLPGFVSAISLTFYTALTVLLLGWFQVNLTLPGIAGIILSMGMAVDANVVIFERIIDELKLGKTLRASVEAGFHRAIAAVVDSNVTTIIAAAVLLWMGTGTVKGFAITLLIGVLVSMFTAIVITKFLLVQIVNLNVKNRRLYGIGVK